MGLSLVSSVPQFLLENFRDFLPKNKSHTTTTTKRVEVRDLLENFNLKQGLRRNVLIRTVGEWGPMFPHDRHHAASWVNASLNLTLYTLNRKTLMSWWARWSLWDLARCISSCVRGVWKVHDRGGSVFLGLGADEAFSHLAANGSN